MQHKLRIMTQSPLEPGDAFTSHNHKISTCVKSRGEPFELTRSKMAPIDVAAGSLRFNHCLN